MVWSGTAVGDWTLSCVTGRLESVTFVFDDGTIFRLAGNRFMLTCGSPCGAWLRKSAFGFDDVTITDISDTLAALSLQGPTSCAVLKKMGLAWG